MSIDFLEHVQDPKSILIIKPSSLGDVVHTLPAVSVLKKQYPDAKLHWVVNTEWAPLLQGNPDLESIIEFPRRQWRGWRDLGKAQHWARETLGGLAPDLAIDFQGLLRSGLLAKASGAALKVGFRQAREGASFFYDIKVDIPDWKTKHAVDRYLDLVSRSNEPIVFNLPEGDSVPGHDATGHILLHPFSRGQGKSLSFGEVVEFCEACADHKVFIVGAGINWPIGMNFPSNAVNLLGETSIAQLMHLMRQAAYIVSVDSGPMHLAAGITDRILSIHTWTDPMMVGPYCRQGAIYRDGKIKQVHEVSPGEFPEDRKRKRGYPEGSPLLAEGAIAEIAAHVKAGVDQSSN